MKLIKIPGKLKRKCKKYLEKKGVAQSIHSHFDSQLLRLNSFLGNYKEVLWLIGDGRSGTTWVSDLLNHDGNYREMFEPFHPERVTGMEFLQPHQYLRPDDDNQQLLRIAGDVFTGQFQHHRVDSTRPPYLVKGLLIKDIFANLFSYWASLRYPHIKPVLLIRNPFAVALSKCKKKNWFWAIEPMELLQQKHLYLDYLHPHEDLIRRISKAGDFIQCQILFWAIINSIPLRQFDQTGLHVVFYEEVFTRPSEEISKIFNFLKPDSAKIFIELDREIVNRPSKVIGKDSNMLNGTSPITSWKNEITPQQINSGREILEHFGLDELYGDTFMPKRRIIDHIMQT